MLTLNVLNQEIFCGTREECREMWKDESKRGRIFLESEVSLLLICEVEVIEKALALKLKKPGTIITEHHTLITD